MTDVAPFSMGIQVCRSEGGRILASGLYLPIIERNTVIPTSRSTIVSCPQDNQRQLLIQVYQGEARHVVDNVELGKLTIPVPPGPGRQGAGSISASPTTSADCWKSKRPCSAPEQRTGW